MCTGPFHPAAASCPSVETGTSGLKAASSLRYDAAVTKSFVTSRCGISAPSAGPAATRYRLSRENRRRFLSGERADARHGLERAVERGLAITSSCDSGPIGFRRGRASPTPTPPPPEGKRSHVGHIKAGGPPSASEASCRRRVRGAGDVRRRQSHVLHRFSSRDPLRSTRSRKESSPRFRPD